jgi:hypothetical protein
MTQDHSVAQETGTNIDWLEVLDRYSVEFLALSLHGDGDLVRFFRSQPGWAVDFEDEEAVLFARVEAVEL